jgi:hypothetical protein
MQSWVFDYGIDTKTRLEIKWITGKIIPIITTTTAMVVVAGFISSDMYKRRCPICTNGDDM